MSKGYWVVQIDVSDMTGFQRYMKEAQAPFKQYGARYLVRAGTVTAREGGPRSRTTVLEFPSVEAATACYQSPEYQAARQGRLAVSACDLVVITGYDGPQPGESA
jgi:uncharacterized protein (DUF1330 family)